jgi:hypothetical protein
MSDGSQRDDLIFLIETKFLCEVVDVESTTCGVREDGAFGAVDQSAAQIRGAADITDHTVA